MAESLKGLFFIILAVYKPFQCFLIMFVNIYIAVTQLSKNAIFLQDEPGHHQAFQQLSVQILSTNAQLRTLDLPRLLFLPRVTLYSVSAIAQLQKRAEGKENTYVYHKNQLFKREITTIYFHFFCSSCLFHRLYQFHSRNFISSFPLTGGLVKHHLISWAKVSSG